jgi:hypothetical protein
MEFILSLGKEILLVPVWALIQSPFLRWSAKLTKASSVSIRAAFTLGLITGAASLIVSLMLYPLYELIGDPFAKAISLLVVLGATVWLYGYFLRGEAGNSIGLWRGVKVLTVEIVLLLAFLFAFAYLFVLAESALT